MENFEKKLEAFAQLAIHTGMNLQKGQDLHIQAPVTALQFVRKVTETAYEAGAKNVFIDYQDEEIMKTKFLKAPEEALASYPAWKAKAFEEMDAANTAYLQVYALNPTVFADVDPVRIGTAVKAAGAANKAHHKNISNGKVSWSVVSVPTDEWAMQVFAGKKKKEAVEALWEAIFEVSRVNGENPIADWEEHIHQLSSRAEMLTEKQYRKLHYQGPGTDLTIELPQGHIWKSAQFINKDGVSFVPNIPTEEVFTIPLKKGVNGVVSSTLPLNYNGVIIDKFKLTFESGKVTDYSAEVGYDSLKEMLDTDEGAKFLGEVALVPHDSPISNSGILFYNTLFDENASCHLAVGSTIPVCYEGGTDMTTEELLAAGLNDSVTHIDFMIGSADLNIDGELEDGTKEAIFRDGNWAF